MKGQTMTRTFNKIGKIVAVVSGIVLMGAVFSGCGFLESMFDGSTSAKSTSTKAKTASNEANSEGKCSGNEIKTDTGIEKGKCKGGKREGVWKHYDKSGYEVQQERTYKNGKLDGAVKKIVRNVDENTDKLIEIAKYADGKLIIGIGTDWYSLTNNIPMPIKIDELMDKRISFTGKVDIETYEYGNIQVWRVYGTDIDSKNQSLFREAEYQNKEAEEQAKQKAQEIAKNNAESKIKKPTMQEVAKSKGIMDSYRAKLQAQYDIEYQKALQSELAKIKKVEPKYIKNDTMDDYLAYIKSSGIKPYIEIIVKDNLKIVSKASDGYYGHTFYDYPNPDRYIAIGYIFVKDNKCTSEKGYSCIGISKMFKELIDKSAFKDKIYSALQNR